MNSQLSRDMPRGDDISLVALDNSEYQQNPIKPSSHNEARGAARG